MHRTTPYHQRISALAVSLSLSLLLGWFVWPQTGALASPANRVEQALTAAVDCASQPWVVTDTASLNEALDCYSSEVGGSGTISFAQDITLDGATQAITNSFGTALYIAGNHHEIDGANSIPYF